MKKILLSLVVMLMALSVGSKASALVKVDARYWFTDLSGTAQVANGSISGTNFDFVNDLGVDEKKGFPEGRITLELGGHKLRYAFLRMKWDGSNTLSQTITFNGQSYTSGAQVDSSLKIDYHRLGYEYDIINTLDNHVGVIFDVKYFDASASLDSTSLSLSESKNFNVPIPTVGVSAQVGLPFLFSVGGELTGVTLGQNVYLFDGEAAVNLKPAPFVVLSGGYRVLKLHLEKDLDKGDLTVKGPFINLRADF